MPQSPSKVYTQIIFSAKHRKNLIDDTIENDLYNYIGGIYKDLECNSVKVGGEGQAPAMGLLDDGLICYHRALHDVTDRRSSGT